ncbi:MAG: histidine triad nucleotide-binding protein [bacterium]
MSETIFSKIIRGEIPCDKVYEDDLCLAFRDINPAAPTHILIIPKKFMLNCLEATDDDKMVLGHMLLKTAEIAKAEGLEGYRLVINNGVEAGQSVFHLHMHVLGGRSLSWPPG